MPMHDHSQQIQLITALVSRISNKLTALGYSKREINDQILSVTKRILKLKQSSFKNLQKCLNQKAQAQELNKKNLYMVAVQLDLYLNSIYDNYDSQSESNNLKIEHQAPLQSSKSKIEQDRQRQESLNKNQLIQQYLFESRYDLLRNIKREPTLEGYRNRRLFEKMERRRQVKLEYLNFNY